MNVNDPPLLTVRNLSKQYGPGCPDCSSVAPHDPAPSAGSVLDSATTAHDDDGRSSYCAHCGTVHACRGLSFEVYPGEILGVVGESGSGKSTLMRCLYFDEDATSGELYLQAYGGGKRNLFTESPQQKRSVRNNLMGKVYQNPLDGLRMDFSALGNIAEKMIAAGYRQVDVMTRRAQDLLTHVKISPDRIRETPRHFSGGMQQRVQIAKALSNDPPLLLLDEVTTGLDLSVQAKVLDLIRQIQRELGISMIIVSHDLAVIRMLADRTLVLVNGQIIEQGLTDQILEDPQHPRTQELVHALL